MNNSLVSVPTTVYLNRKEVIYMINIHEDCPDLENLTTDCMQCNLSCEVHLYVREEEPDEEE